MEGFAVLPCDHVGAQASREGQAWLSKLRDMENVKKLRSYCHTQYDIWILLEAKF